MLIGHKLRFAGVVVAGVFSAGALHGAAFADGEPEQAALQGYVMPDTQVWNLPGGDGQIYRIFVSIPEAAPPQHGFPVLYVLDGNAMFAGFAESRRLQEIKDPDIGRSIVVGIGYPAGKPYDLARRLYDFTPPFPEQVPASERDLAKMRTGGEQAFMAFLLDRLRPEIARRYAVDPDRQALFGHSLGGLFALHMLYTRPGAFRAIIAASPTQWWNDQQILQEERTFSQRLRDRAITGPVARLMLVAGDREAVKLNVWDAEALARRLQPLSAYGLRVRFEAFKDEDHLSVPARAVTPTLRFAFAFP